MTIVGRPRLGSTGWCENKRVDVIDTVDDTHHTLSPRRASIAHSIKSVNADVSCIRCWYPGRMPRVIPAEIRCERQQEKIAQSFDALWHALSIPTGPRPDAVIGKTADAIQRVLQEVKRLVALMPDLRPADGSAEVTVFRNQAYRCVDSLPSTIFSRLCQGPMSPEAEHADADYRAALLMRLHRCMDLPAETTLCSLEQALRGRYLDQEHAQWLCKAQRDLADRTASTLAQRAAFLTAEQDRRWLQSALHGIFLKMSKGQPKTLAPAGVGVFFALAKLPAALRSLYQRCLPFEILNKASQDLPRLRVPIALAIEKTDWDRYCRSWRHEYVRRNAALDEVIEGLKETFRLPDECRGIRTRRAAFGLSQLAGLLRVGLAGEDLRNPPVGDLPDTTRYGVIGHRYADVVEVIHRAANVLGLGDAPLQADVDWQEAALGAMSDKEFAALVSSLDVMPAFGLDVEAHALAAERDRRVALLGQARLRPCLERLAAMPFTPPAPIAVLAQAPPPVMATATPENLDEDLHQMSEIGVYLRDATDALQALVLLYSVSGGVLDGAEETAAFIAKAVNLAVPDLHIEPARADALRRLSVALNDARADLARNDPGLLHDGADDFLAREKLIQDIADRLDRQDDVPDFMNGAFFLLIRRASFAARLGAFVSSAPAQPMNGEAAAQGLDPDAPALDPATPALDPATFGKDGNVLADADIRLALQSDFGIEVVLQVPARDAAEHGAKVPDATMQETVVQDALGRYVRWPDWEQSLTVRQIYREELSFRNPIRRLSGVAAMGAPGSYPVNAAVVNEEYARDYLRGSCSLSVRGRTPDGTPMAFDAVTAGPIVDDQMPDAQARRRARVLAVEGALQCLSRIVDASQFQQLTRLLSQMAAAPVWGAEIRSAAGTPLRLASGTPLQVGGPAHTHTLIEQNLDDTFDMSYHVEWLNVSSANLVDLETYLPAGPLELDPVLSRKAVRFAWRVSAGAQPVVQPLQLPEYRYCLVPAPMSRTSSFLPGN